jgi:hypothetical protein
MASTYSVTQALAWGITPQWVTATLNQESGYQTSTKKSSKKNSWGTKTYYSTTYNYPTEIDPDGFTLSNWNSYSDSTKGSKANNTFSGRYYGISTNSGAWVINYKTATNNWAATDSSTWTQVSKTTGTSITAKTTIQNSLPVTQTYNITLSQGVTNTSSSQLSSAWSNSTTLAIGAQVSAQYEAIGVEFSSTLTQSNTISGTSTSSQGSSQTQSINRSLSTPIPPNSTYEFVLQIDNSKAGFGWTAPYLIETDDVRWSADQAAVFTMGAGTAANYAIEYGYPSSAIYSVTANKAFGVFAGTSSSNYNSNASIKSYEVSSSESDSASLSASRSALMGSGGSADNQASGKLKFRPRAMTNGVGFSIKADTASRLLRGSMGDDRLFSSERDRQGRLLKGDQTFALFEGEDVLSSYGTNDDVSLTLSGLKMVSTRAGNDKVFTSAPGTAQSIQTNVNLDVGSGKDQIHFDDLSNSQLLSGFITLGSGKDVVSINLRNRGSAKFLFTDLQPGKDRLELSGMDGQNLRFEATPGGQLVGFYNDTKLLHFRSDFLGAASSRYTLNKSTEKYEVAFLNFGFYALDSMPETLTDLFVQFAGQSVTSLNKKLYTSWDQVKNSEGYLKMLSTKVVTLGAGDAVSSKDQKNLISYGIGEANSSSSIFEWINDLERKANSMGIDLTLPNSI